MPYFLAVARSGSLRAAAEGMNATHATVRRHIQSLETSLGVQLFRRSREGLELTVAGRKLLPDAQAAEEILQQARGGLQGLDREATGLIRMSLDPMSGHYLLAPIFARFCALYPEIELDIRLTYDIEDINRFESDISLRHAAQVTEDVVARKLFPLDIGIYASRDYIAQALPASGKQGAGLNWIGYGDVPEMGAWIAASPFPAARVRHNVADPEMHLHLARSGAGMSFLPVWCEHRFPELQRLPDTEIDRTRSIWLLLHADLRRVTRVRLLVDFLANSLLEMRAQFRGR